MCDTECENVSACDTRNQRNNDGMRAKLTDDLKRLAGQLAEGINFDENAVIIGIMGNRVMKNWSDTK